MCGGAETAALRAADVPRWPGASTKNGAIDNQFVDNVEVSFRTLKRVPQPPHALGLVSTTPDSLIVNWTAHEEFESPRTLTLIGGSESPLTLTAP